ncbi:MAG: PSD1 and planctomycete cytochrome C domain-containing protein [Armatimonadota bacterium]
MAEIEGAINGKWRRKLSLIFPILSAGIAGLAVSFPGTAQLPQATPDQTVFFEAKIRPVLAENCYSCHGSTSQSGGLRLDNSAGILKGGSSGIALISKDPTKSLLLLAVHQTGSLKMPPGKKLKAEEIANLETWIDMGAPWPAESVAPKAQLWSLKPVIKAPVPNVTNSKWVRNPIDNFIVSKLESQKLTPSSEADRRTLIRRVTYDLIGLPPSSKEVDEFLADKAPDAYEKVVSRLLALPQYGERWGRQWLDVARYADTKGYVFEEDRNYPNAYTYRDWVIDALNRDLPYDQFVTQQLAADCLPEIQNGDNKKPLAALGFLNIGRRFLNSQPDIIDDRIDVTMRGFQGFTVACARCHDHKFDPIPTQDYYSLYSVFASTSEVNAPISDKSIREPWLVFNQKETATVEALKSHVMFQVSKLRTMLTSPTLSQKLSDGVKQALQAVRPEVVPEGVNLSVLADAFDPADKAKMVSLQADLESLREGAPATPEFAMAMQDNPNPSDGVVFKRGNPGSPGEVAPRRFLLALSKPGEERAHWKNGSGRLQLAQSITSKDNPLTARVFVNRVWQGHFGAGIVRTPSDFGFQGDRPIHPELLDYLASTFMEEGWSVKKLHQLIVTSATYRQSSAVSAATFNADPENRYLSHMNRRRLDLEQLRDSVFLASGRLDQSKIGGKSVDLWSAPYTPRRALYGFVERQNLPGIFRTFDFASPDSTSARRFMTTVPQQALFFMNSPLSIEQAKIATSRSELVGASDDTQRIKRLYQLLFARQPDASEITAGLGYLKPGSQSKVAAPQSEWRYGFGEYDGATKKTSAFTPLAYFGENSYRVSKDLPDPKLGYIILNPDGGHPGRDAAHQLVRRWVAPENLVVQVKARLKHSNAGGDGVKARIVSSREGLLGEWVVHNSMTQTEVGSINVQKGDTLDFIIDPQTNDGYDATEWSPTIESADGKRIWSAKSGFGPPPGEPLNRITLYAQALMMTNEFLFVD